VGFNNFRACGRRSRQNGKVKYKAVLFDLDDTLLRTIETCWDHHRAVCREIYGFELTDDELRANWGAPFIKLLPALYRNSDTYENMLAAERSLAHRFPIVAFDDALSVLTKLADTGIAVGIVTSADRHLVERDLENIGFPEERLAVLQTSEDTDVHKPDPAVFEPALAKLATLGIERAEILYVGDSVNDFKAANGAGIDFLGVTTGLTTAALFTDAGADQVTERLGAWFQPAEGN
jgi:HAD superfamily hydrolase (TIGR01549 family)